MASNAAKGARYKARTRIWLAAQGYQVAEMEVVRWVGAPATDGKAGRGRFPVKRDQFASDLMGMRADGIVFVQIKGGKAAAGGGTFPEAQRKFAEFVFALGARRWIVAWPPRAREPRVIDCTDLPVPQKRAAATTETEARLF